MLLNPFVLLHVLLEPKHPLVKQISHQFQIVSCRSWVGRNIHVCGGVGKETGIDYVLPHTISPKFASEIINVAEVSTAVPES